MPTPKPDLATNEAFLRYQRHGRPEDLATVFDGTAAELLRVANYLTPGLDVADDMVQATYLTAIENRHSYKPQANVTAWLLGILVNLVRSMHRSQGRIPASTVSLVDVEAVAKGGDSHRALEVKELTKAVADGIAKLPEIYRSTLSIHLRFGLQAKEIALSLHQPLPTVRKRLSRGMALLRKALPSSLIAGTVVLTTPVSGLTAMREAVLTKATATLAAQSAVGTSTAALAKLGLWVSAGTLSAAALALVFSGSTPDLGSGLDAEPSSSTVAHVAANGQEDSVDSPAVAMVAQQANPFSPVSQGVTLFSVAKFNRKATTMNSNNSNSASSTMRGLGLPGFIFGASMLMPGMSQAQSVIYNHDGPVAGARFGTSVSDAGDVNFDGYADVIVGSPRDGSGPDGIVGTGDDISFGGNAFVFSGKDGNPLYTKLGGTAFDQFGNFVSGLGDLNADGYDDFAVANSFRSADPDGTPASGDELVV